MGLGLPWGRGQLPTVPTSASRKFHSIPLVRPNVVDLGQSVVLPGPALHYFIYSHRGVEQRTEEDQNPDFISISMDLIADQSSNS